MNKFALSTHKAKAIVFTLACIFVPAIFKKLFMLFAELFTIVTIGTGSIFLFVIAYAFMYTCFIMTIISGCNVANKVILFLKDKEYREEILSKMPEFAKQVISKYFK